MNEWWHWNGETVIALLICISIFLAVIGLAVGLAFFVDASGERQCNAKTESIGYPHRWQSIGGCQIEISPGRWVPLENFCIREGQ